MKSVSNRVIRYLRTTSLVIGLILWIAGAIHGIFGNYAEGAWLILVGFGLVYISDAGRPVVINMFSELADTSQSRGKDKDTEYVGGVYI